MEAEQIQVFYPEAPALKRHIEYYYFLKTEDDGFCSNYYAFPHINQSFNIHRNISCEIDQLSVRIQHDPANDYCCILQGKYSNPLQVALQGKLDKVTIIFKPLGINHFIKPALGDIAKQSSQIFTAWDGDAYYHRFLKAFYQTDDFRSRLLLLENFLLTQYNPPEKAAMLEPALEMLSDFDQEYTIGEISDSLSLNARTFNRLFHQFLAVSPVTYRKIARFRHSLKNKLFRQQFQNLTQIGYQSNFYDQSYFNKVYRKITGDNPSQFFNSIAKLADDQLILKFIKK
ncbi:helix-turn-helix domain-containing protein [Chitinophaga barathri]|uniref:AraC family transcriptional regulator n=1 Tax=Chitinophaga barathri TaxID=1647451 RepID=A0A3N4MMZ8_9BACT|nr:helix-turn-helix domain-containing protein [Chitinophaga barathri]RPD41420.1 AraC family transcriptional regulator [Chitinophaga barathri]